MSVSVLLLVRKKPTGAAARAKVRDTAMTPNPPEGGAPDTGERPSATADRYLIGDLAQEFAITTRTSLLDGCARRR